MTFTCPVQVLLGVRFASVNGYKLGLVTLSEIQFSERPKIS